MDAALAKKLLMKPGTSFAVVEAPGEHAMLVEGGGATRQADVVLVYATKQAEVRSRVPKVKKALRPDARLWVAYPKAKKLGTDLDRDVLSALLREHGLEPVRLVSVDETWSAMWFKPV